MRSTQFRLTSADFAPKEPGIEEAVLSADDPIHDLMQLAGLPPAQQVIEDSNAGGAFSPVGSSSSVSAMEKRQLERDHDIKVGTDEWFRLWFSKEGLTGEKPIRNKNGS
jgi:hypothetical protein